MAITRNPWDINPYDPYSRQHLAEIEYRKKQVMEMERQLRSQYYPGALEAPSVPKEEKKPKTDNTVLLLL